MGFRKLFLDKMLTLIKTNNFELSNFKLFLGVINSCTILVRLQIPCTVGRNDFLPINKQLWHFTVVKLFKLLNFLGDDIIWITMSRIEIITIISLAHVSLIDIKNYNFALISLLLHWFKILVRCMTTLLTGQSIRL